MSRRRIENAFSASSFKLQSTHDPASTAPLLSAADRVGRQATPPPPPSPSLKFNLDGMKMGNGVAASASNVTLKPSSFAPIRYQTNANNPELMRLSAQTDDLKMRLKGSTEKAMFLETQLQKMQKTVLKERSEFSKQIALGKNELMASRDSEKALKAQVAKLQAEAQRKPADFSSAVKNALDVSEMESVKVKLDEMESRKVTVEAQIEQLEKRRLEVVEEKQKAVQERDAVFASLASAQQEWTLMSAEHADVKKNLEASNLEHQSVMANVEAARADVEAARADVQAAKTDVESVLKQRLDAERAVSALEAELRAKMHTCINPVGDMHPTDSKFDMASDDVSSIGAIHDESSFSTGIAYHFSYDSPLDLTGYHSHWERIGNEEEEEETVGESSEESGSVSAVTVRVLRQKPASSVQAFLGTVVSDIKSTWAEANHELQQRGHPSSTVGAPSGVDASAVASTPSAQAVLGDLHPQNEDGL